MRVIARGTLRAFVTNCVQPKDRDVVGQQLESWYRLTLSARWQNSSELKAQFGLASIVSASRVVFNIKGNRMVVSVSYQRGSVTIVWLGTHREYDGIDVKEVTYDRARYFGSSDRD